MAGGKTFKRDQKRRKEMARKLKQEEKMKKKTKKAEGLISRADLRKLALGAFKEGKDTVTLSIHREEKQVKVKLKFEEGCVRFAGNVMSKFVKENLEDE